MGFRGLASKIQLQHNPFYNLLYISTSIAQNVICGFKKKERKTGTARLIKLRKYHLLVQSGFFYLIQLSKYFEVSGFHPKFSVFL